MRRNGFTLVDTTICCLILGTVAVFGLSSLDGIAAQQNLQAACQGLMSDLFRARVAAIAGNLPVRIQVRPDRKAYSLLEPGDVPRWRELARGVAFEEFPKSPVVFYSRGSAVPAGTYKLSNRSGSVQIIVAASGRARWKRSE